MFIIFSVIFFVYYYIFIYKHIPGSSPYFLFYHEVLFPLSFLSLNLFFLFYVFAFFIAHSFTVYFPLFSPPCRLSELTSYMGNIIF